MSELIGYLSEVEQLNGELTIPKQLGGSTLGTKTITENDTYYAEDDGLDGYSEVTVNVSGGDTPVLETITKTYTPTESQQTEQITAGSGYDAIEEVDVTVNAVPSSYVGSGVARKSSSDLAASGATVNVPAGYYESAASKAVASGTEGTPTATKGAVSNHSVAVTPSVTNTAGYIAGGTKTGTAVTVSASELDSGTKSITANGSNQDVVGYAAVDVAVPNSYSAADEGKVVSSGALVAQTSDTVTTNDTYDTTLINSLTVNVSGGGGKTNIDIGIQNTSIPSIFNMFYALESGTAATGQYTPAQALPNVDTELFDTGLATVHGLFIADESQATLNTGSTPDNLLFGIVFNPSYDDAGTSDYSGYTYACSRGTTSMQNSKNGTVGRLVSRGSWTITNGKFIYKSAFNKNDSYCAFHSAHTYRWVAW